MVHSRDNDAQFCEQLLELGPDGLRECAAFAAKRLMSYKDRPRTMLSDRKIISSKARCEFYCVQWEANEISIARLAKSPRITRMIHLAALFDPKYEKMVRDRRASNGIIAFAHYLTTMGHSPNALDTVMGWDTGWPWWT